MIELSPQTLLPKEYEKFKQQIPNLKLAETLSPRNPLKNLLSKIENYHNHGNFYNLILCLIVFYFILMVVKAFLQEHPTSWGMLMLLLPILGVAYFSRKGSPFKIYSLMQIVLLRGFDVLNKAFRKLPAKEAKWHTSKQGTIQISSSYELKFDLRHLHPTLTPKQKQLKQIQKHLIQILKDRCILLFGSILGGIFYYQLAFFVAGDVISQNDKLHSALSDIFMLNAELSPYAFQNMFLLSLVAINFILYSGNVFLPYEYCQVKHYLKSDNKNFFEKWIYTPLINLSLLGIGMVALMFICAFVTIIYTSIYAIPSMVVICILMITPHIIFYYLFLIFVIVFRYICRFINKD